MFISKERWEELNRCIEKPETYSHNDYNRLNNITKAIESLKETVGTEEYSLNYWDIAALYGLMGRHEPERKKLTLTQKVNQIMEATGLTIKYQHEDARIIKKPTPAKRTAKKETK